MDEFVAGLFAKGSLFLYAISIVCILAGCYLLYRGIQGIRRDFHKGK